VADVTDGRSRASSAVRAIAAALVVAIAAGVVLLWPGALRSDGVTDTLGADSLVSGTVVSVTDAPCDGTEAGAGITCTVADVELTDGPDDGTTVTLPEDPDDGGVGFDVGDHIVLAHYADAGEGFEYAYADRERTAPMLALAALALVLLVAIARLCGAKALAAIVAGVGVATVFVLPSLLDGHDPLLVALIGAGAIVVLTTVVRHGVGRRAALAVLGAGGGLAVVAVLGSAFVGLTQLAGLAAEDTSFFQVAGGDIDLRGIVLAGVVIGTAGLLVDLATRQVSEVEARGDHDRRDAFRQALRAGGDHASSATTSLVLAYAGASLPLLLALTQSRQGLADTATSEIIATEIVRALVGAIGLVAVVPITTLLAMWVGGDHVDDGAARNDPRRYASRAERQLWEQASAPPPPPVEPEPPLPPNRAL
jgi:uncharacterized membrane protein